MNKRKHLCNKVDIHTTKKHRILYSSHFPKKKEKNDRPRILHLNKFYSIMINIKLFSFFYSISTSTTASSTITCSDVTGVCTVGKGSGDRV